MRTLLLLVVVLASGCAQAKTIVVVGEYRQTGPVPVIVARIEYREEPHGTH